jgi:hypothetical protein
LCYISRMEFPLDLRFKLMAIASQLTVTDARGDLVYYVKQKAFKLKEAVTVFADQGQTRPLYTINADRILDVSPRYRVTDPAGGEVAVIQRMGMRSFWKAHYEIYQGSRRTFVIREENPWIKVLDGIVSSIPIVSLFAGYMFHPAYVLSRGEGESPILRISKRPALFEGRFTIDAVQPPSAEPLDVPVVSVLMMILLERARG